MARRSFISVLLPALAAAFLSTGCRKEFPLLKNLENGQTELKACRILQVNFANPDEMGGMDTDIYHITYNSLGDPARLLTMASFGKCSGSAEP
ncbi:MAG TPA: hypothetical protein VGR89_17105 [Puia sp.]|nr:hypothetical protein [Puia sp.]